MAEKAARRCLASGFLKLKLAGAAHWSGQVRKNPKQKPTEGSGMAENPDSRYPVRGFLK